MIWGRRSGRRYLDPAEELSRLRPGTCQLAKLHISSLRTRPDHAARCRNRRLKGNSRLLCVPHVEIILSSAASRFAPTFCSTIRSHDVPSPKLSFEVQFPLFSCSTLFCSLALVRCPFVHRSSGSAEHWEREADFVTRTGNRPGRQPRTAGNRPIIRFSDNAIRDVSPVVPDNAANPEPAGSVPHGSCRSASTMLAPSGGISPAPR
jgi:hypothetical protein